MNKLFKDLHVYLKKDSIDALLVTNPFNISYLSGFVSLSPTERESYMLITKEAIYFFTNSLYFDQKLVEENNTQGIESILLTHESPISKQLSVLCNKYSLTHLGIEERSITYAEYKDLTEKLEKVTFIPADQIISRTRTIKLTVEMEAIREACKLTDQCLTEIVPTIKAGQTEGEVEWCIEQWVRSRGKVLAFSPTIVAVDTNSALPHHRSGRTKIKKGSAVLIDMGIAHNHHVSDITRMVFIGTPDQKMVSTYQKLLTAQKETIDFIPQAKQMSEIDVFCRERMKISGLPSCPHSTGHGIGLEIHELPHVSFRSQEPLVDSMVFTIEPGVYYEGKWGMRIEDSVYFHNGKVEVLTKFPKEMCIL